VKKEFENNTATMPIKPRAYKIVLEDPTPHGTPKHIYRVRVINILKSFKEETPRSIDLPELYSAARGSSLRCL